MHASMAEGGGVRDGMHGGMDARGRRKGTGEGEEMSSFRNGGCHSKEVIAVGAARRLIRTQVDRPETAKFCQFR